MNDGPTATRAEGGHLHDHGEVGESRAFDQELSAAQEAHAAGDAAGARALLEKAVRHTPNDQRARNLLGLTLFKLGDLERAEAIYRGLIEDHPADPTLRVNLGLVFLKRGASNDAARCFTTALDLQPEHSKAQNYLGLAFAQKGDHAQARDWFSRSGNTAMAERMTALLATATQAAAAAHAAHLQPARESRETVTAPVTENAPLPRQQRLDTAEFARVRPTDAFAGAAPSRESTLRPVEIGRMAIPLSSTRIPSNPTLQKIAASAAQPIPSSTSLQKVAPKTLPTWPAQPSGSTLEGATSAMRVPAEQPDRDAAADTDPTLAVPSVLSATAGVLAAGAADPAASIAPPGTSPGAVANSTAPRVATAELPAVAAPVPVAELIAAPITAPAVLAAPAQSGSSAGAPRPVEPTPLSSYTNQRRLEVPAAESSFAIGSAELVIHVRGEMLTRLDGLVASWGTATVRPELKRFRGKATDKAFGEGARRMLRVSGEGRYVIAREGRAFTPLELGDEPAYFREEILFAFEESLVFENGRVPSKLGSDLHLVHLRGRGRLLLVSAGEPRSVEVKKGEPLRIPMNQLVGWHGPLIQPRVVSIVEEAPEFGIALELSGEGRALVDSSDASL